MLPQQPKLSFIIGSFSLGYVNRGAGLVSEGFQDITETLDITPKSFTPAYSPQGNQVKCAHDVIRKRILRSDITGVERVPYAVFAYKISTNRVTGVSAYFSLYGRKAVLHADLLVPLPKDRDDKRED